MPANLPQPVDPRAPRLLASDLDGTLLPPPTSPAGRAAVDRFKEFVRATGLRLAYVTGRHLNHALEGVNGVGLPLPEAFACDVGTTIFWRNEEVARPEAFRLDAEYRAMIAATPGVIESSDVQASLVDVAGLTLQEPDKQTAFKTSYYADPRRLPHVVDEVRKRLAPLGRARLVVSEDLHLGRGMLDVLPEGVGKATAVEFIRERLSLERHDLVFAGDSGNDRDAMLNASPAIAVANTPEDLKVELRDEAARLGRSDSIFFSPSPFATGVMEGLRHFGILDRSIRRS